MAKKISVMSIIIGLLTGALLGWWMGSAISTLVNTIDYSTILLIVFGVLGGFFGYSKPVEAEAISFGITILIFFQFIWDIGVNDWNSIRTILALSAIGIFILNLLSGKLKVGSARKTLKQQLGIRK